MSTEENRNECSSYDICHNEGYDYGYDIGFRDGHKEGYDLGIEEGRQIGFCESYDSGYSTGYDKGYNEGYDTGIEIGERNGDEDNISVDLSAIKEVLFMYYKNSMDVEPLVYKDNHVCITSTHKCPFIVTVSYNNIHKRFCAYLNEHLTISERYLNPDEESLGIYEVYLVLDDCPLKELL